MIDEEQQLEARKRAQEYREMAEVECPNGGFLFGGPRIEPEIATPPCPEHLSEIARSEWDRMTQDLIAKGLLTSTDGPALAAYCAAYGRWADAEQNIQKFGTVIKTKSGSVGQNPYVAIAEKALDTMHKFLSLLDAKTQPDGKTVF